MVDRKRRGKVFVIVDRGANVCDTDVRDRRDKLENIDVMAATVSLYPRMQKIIDNRFDYGV
jgi:hypothetical protein